jgi:MutS domain V
MVVSPAEQYSNRLAARELRVRHLEAIQEQIGTARLLLAVILIVLAWLSWHGRWLSPAWLLVPGVVFAGVVTYHAMLRRKYSDAVRAAAFYRRGLARIEDRWAGGGLKGERFSDVHHVYAADLDIFGAGGLFELLCDVRTRMGEETLAAWLLAPAPREEIEQRHASVADLRDRLDLREHIGKLGEEAKTAVDPEALTSWVASPSVLGQPWVRWIAVLLPLLLLGSLILGGLTDVWIPCILILAIQAGVLYGLRVALMQVLNPAERAFDSDDLKTFAALLSKVEHESFDSQPMRALVSRLSKEGRHASSRIGQLRTIVGFSEQRKNVVVGILFAVPLLYTLQVALAAERWRRANKEAVRDWVEATGRFEALSALAQYSFEHPSDPFPILIEGQPCLCAKGIGHPLIPLVRCVRSDVRLVAPVRVLLVSGSNMSGKSTLLRAVGLNTVLAMAGAPVRAQSLELTPLQVGATIRINDSLREGSSQFYAEITRLRQIHELAESGRVVLFLLDEMLQGTNSKDRRIGAEGILRALGEHGAIGIATTHDLALTELQGLGDGALRNVHFQDYLENGRMRFDFELHDGVVTKSNGLELMRAIGLRV